MAKPSILVIGDKKRNLVKPNRSLVNFIKYTKVLQQAGQLQLAVISYEQLFSGQLPSLTATPIKVVFFFPYHYWNHYIEIYRDQRIYGDIKFGQGFQAFFKKVKRAIERHYPRRELEYLNSPQACYLNRDKKKIKALLQKNNIPTPRALAISSFSQVKRLLNKGLSIYIKPRFGAMGKGITYIDKHGMISNFIFRNGKIISRSGDYNWKFARIKDEQPFVNKLLKRGFLCEEAIWSAEFRNRRFDFRVYVMFGRVVYLYAKSSPSQFYVTNWSQGGSIDKKQEILSSLPKKKIILLRTIARKTARVLHLNFAGIDIIFSQDLRHAYVLEGNVFPGYEKGFDLMQCLLDFLKK